MLSMFLMTCAMLIAAVNGSGADGSAPALAAEKQVTHGRGGRILTNIGVWSPDGNWLAYDTRSDPAGDCFDARTIEMVHMRTGEVRELYRSTNGANCAVVTFHPRQQKVAFILGPEHPTPEWSYNAWHRRGVIVDCSRPGLAANLDARDVSYPFTPGALRGGSHVHVWEASGEWISFTYEDHVLASPGTGQDRDINQRNIGVSAPVCGVRVGTDHPRNHDGLYFSVLVTKTVAHPRPGSDDISRAYEEGWVGTNGYVRPDGSRQRRALAFQGQVVTHDGKTISEVFIVDLPANPTREGEGPLCGTETRRPAPPAGTAQRRLTFTASCKYPGLQGPRHWLRSAPDGSRIAFLMKDVRGIVQIHTVSPNGGPTTQLTSNNESIASSFTWSPDGKHLAHVMDSSVCLTVAATGQTIPLTRRYPAAEAPRPEACVFSPDGKRIAYVRRVAEDGQWSNQLFVLELNKS